MTLTGSWSPLAGAGKVYNPELLVRAPAIVRRFLFFQVSISSRLGLSRRASSCFSSLRQPDSRGDAEYLRYSPYRRLKLVIDRQHEALATEQLDVTSVSSAGKPQFLGLFVLPCGLAAQA